MHRILALSALSLAVTLAAPRAGAQPAPAELSSPQGAPPLPAPEVSATPEGVDAAELEQWRERDKQIYEQSSLGGGIGLLHVQHAQGAASGQFRVGFTTEFFDSSFLCTQQYPCQNPKGGRTLTNDSMSHIGGTLTLSATVSRWLEAYAATSVSGDSDSANSPTLLQVLGDTELGLKVFRGINSVLFVGGAAELDLVNGAGAVGLAGGSTGGKLRLLGTADLRGMNKPVPLRISLNTTYSVDDTAQVVSGIEAAADTSITRIERFGLELNRVDHVDINLGAETFVLGGRIRPFLEYSMLIAVNRQGYACRPDNPSSDQCLANDAIVPSKLTLGSRFFPWNKNFSLLAAVDVGVTGVANFIEELAPTAPWTVYLGAGWAIDLWDRPVGVTTRVVEKNIPPTPHAHLRGLVHPKDDPHGLVDAIVVFESHPDQTSLATGPDGRFTTPGLAPASYKLAIHAKGYKDGACGGDIGQSLEDVQVDCPVEPALVQVTKDEITIQQQIQFQVDSANILPESDSLMTEIAQTLVKNPRITRVEVQGHTDSSGSAEYNQTLSEQRAASVCAWLEAHGVARGRLVPHGYGKDRPLIPNITKGMKAQNRRVQFIIMDQTPDTAGGP